ncbi:ABC transporter permease [Crocosphaera sp. Alani8]|uniref:ABC transporter permease n=1 Tax=Crocosphaera sp. Alani8 TaxID=3038952 RepID=UPI00313CB696
MSQANSQHPEDRKRKPLPVVVYEPESRVRHPIEFIKQMWFDLLASRELAQQLFQRDIQSQYRQSILGILWIFIPPIVTALGLTLLRKTNVLNVGETPIAYPVFVALSMTLWQTFIQTFNNTMGAARSAKGMLKKLNVPPEAFVLSKLAQTLFNFLIQLIPIVFLFVFFKVGVSWTIILAPVAFIHLVMLGTGFGLILAPFSCLYGDVNKGIGFVTRLWIFVTPVIYPQPREGIWAVLVAINPVTPLLVTTRDLITTGDITDVSGFWIASGIAIITTLFGWVFYRLSIPFLVERA